MKSMLITGGTVFVSRYAAEYFAGRNWHVSVLNRGSRPQSQGVTLIKSDRHALGDILRGKYFDAVLDITAYNCSDVHCLLDALGGFGDYILLSSSAVYPEYTPSPFCEHSPTGENSVWGNYGVDKIAAENALAARFPDGYIIRPPYLYGPMNNLYREAFVFECALADREFFVPGKGDMPLQFFYIEDLCRFMELILEQRPSRHVFNTGNPQSITVRRWAEMCYRAAGKTACIREVHSPIPQRSYFSFYDYAYKLDVAAQCSLMPQLTGMEDGLQRSFEWYASNRDLIIRKPLIEFIDRELR